jgi:hypothetical protein
MTLSEYKTRLIADVVTGAVDVRDVHAAKYQTKYLHEVDLNDIVKEGVI